MRVALALLLFWVAEIPCALAQTAGPQPPREARSDSAVESAQPLIVVSSGGISAGSYQAGVNWAILDALKRARSGELAGELGLHPHELVVATGASAGNVNSILATLEWAQPDAVAPPS